MTDAALPITERAVEEFAEAYLTSLGADIRMDGRRWILSVPEDAETDLELDGAVVQIANDPNEVDEDTQLLAPESRLFEQLVDEAAERTPVGSLYLTHEQREIRLPPWITAGPVDIVDQSFTPYYDRQALCFLFHVGIETVSEYQREELQAITVDLNEQEIRPRLTQTYLEITEGSWNAAGDEEVTIETDRIEETLNLARSGIEDEIEPVVRDTRERATRAAEVELDEYRQFAHDRKDELEEKLASLADRIEEVNETIEFTSEQRERIEALQKRKELRADVENLRSEVDDLAAQIREGFPQKWRGIRDRHALTVRIRPVSATQISYERGDIDWTVSMAGRERSSTYAYAVGTGVLDDQHCESCGAPLSEENPLMLQGSSLIGQKCCGT